MTRDQIKSELDKGRSVVVKESHRNDYRNFGRWHFEHMDSFDYKTDETKYELIVHWRPSRNLCSTRNNDKPLA